MQRLHCFSTKSNSLCLDFLQLLHTSCSTWPKMSARIYGEGVCRALWYDQDTIRWAIVVFWPTSMNLRRGFLIYYGSAPSCVGLLCGWSRAAGDLILRSESYRHCDNYNLKSHKYVCITTYQPDTKCLVGHPNPSPNPATKQNAVVNIQLNVVPCPIYPDKFIRDMLLHRLYYRL